MRDVVILDLPRVSSNHGPAGLSVVSAPAPVMQRPELGRPDTKSSGTSSALSRVGSQQSMPLEPQLGMGTSTRSTKSQRIRGASNSLRLRQLEMRENHAIVFSWGWPRWFVIEILCPCVSWCTPMASSHVNVPTPPGTVICPYELWYPHPFIAFIHILDDIEVHVTTWKGMLYIQSELLRFHYFAFFTFRTLSEV